MWPRFLRRRLLLHRPTPLCGGAGEAAAPTDSGANKLSARQRKISGKSSSLAKSSGTRCPGASFSVGRQQTSRFILLSSAIRARVGRGWELTLSERRSFGAHYRVSFACVNRSELNSISFLIFLVSCTRSRLEQRNVATNLVQLDRQNRVTAQPTGAAYWRGPFHCCQDKLMATTTFFAPQTGFVKVVLKDSEPTYDIVSPSAWDFIEVRPPAAPQRALGLLSTWPTGPAPTDTAPATQETPELMAAVGAADVVVYGAGATAPPHHSRSVAPADSHRRRDLPAGSLAQRAPVSRRTIEAVAAKAKRAVFDVNMRSPFIDQTAITSGLKACYASILLRLLPPGQVRRRLVCAASMTRHACSCDCSRRGS